MTYIADAPRTDVVPGVAVQSHATITVADHRGYDFELVVAIHGGKFEVDRLTATRRAGSPPITGETIRTFAVQGFVREFVHRSIAASNPSMQLDGTASAFGLLPADQARRLKQQGPTRETLEWVATVYRLAELLDDPPTRAVADAFTIAHSTATTWVARARSADMLAPVVRQTAGGR